MTFLDELFVNVEVSGEVLTASTPILLYKMGNEERYGTACRWSSGRASLILFSRTGVKSMVKIPSFQDDNDTMDDDTKEENLDDEDGGQGDDEDMKKIKPFYCSTDVVALDLFRASPQLLESSIEKANVVSSVKKEEPSQT